MSTHSTVTEVEMQDAAAGVQPGLKRIRANSDEKRGSENKHEEPKSKVTKAEKTKENARPSNLEVDSTKLIVQKIEALSESFNTRLSAIETSTKNTEDQVNEAFSSMQKDIEAVKIATDTNAKDIKEIRENLDIASRKNPLSKHDIKEKHDRLRAEGYQRRVNLIFEGIEEGGRRENDITLRQMMNNIFNKEMGINNVDIDVVHRVGMNTQRGPRPIIVRFARLDDRNKIWAARAKLREQNRRPSDKIWIKEDLPREAKEMNNMLYRSLNAARASGKYGNNVSVRNFKFYLNGLSYTTDELEELPVELRPSTLATRQNDTILIFFSKSTVLSNHFICEFTVDGQKYTSVEQYMTRERAIFGKASQETIQKIMNEHDPVQLKTIMHFLKQDNRQKEWEAVAPEKIKPAIIAKFSQNKDLKKILLDTGDKVLGEASPRDRFWGIGLALTARDALDKTKWGGKNVLGQLLREARKTILKQK